MIIVIIVYIIIVIIIIVIIISSGIIDYYLILCALCYHYSNERSIERASHNLGAICWKLFLAEIHAYECLFMPSIR